MTVQVTQRDWVEGLCTWRAALMLSGLLVHGAVGYENIPAMALLGSLSHAFRMGVFFVISGYLSSQALLRRSSTEQWLINRIIQIGVPTVFGIGVLCPLIGLFIDANPETKASPLLWDWYHFWFLIALMIYSVLAYGTHRIDKRFDILGRLERLISGASGWQVRTLVGVASLTALLMTLTGHAVSWLASPAYEPTWMQWRLIAGYVPLFLLGFMIARSKPILEMLTGDMRLPAVIVLVVGTTYALWYLWVSQLLVHADPALVEIPLTNLGAVFCPPSAAALILRSALKIQHVPSIIRCLSDASFTMYVLHLPLIYASRAILGRIAWGPWLEFGIVVCVSGIASYAFHQTVVRRWAPAALLLNGRYRAMEPSSSLPVMPRKGAYT